MSPAQRFFLPSAALSLGLLALPAAAHQAMPGCGPGPDSPASNIVVQGEGRASVAPDLATVSLGVTTQAPTAAQAMADNATRQTAIIEALRAQGVAPADLQTQGLSLSPMQDFSREGQPPRITGYQAQNIVTARIRDLARLGPMLDAMVAAGATDVQGIGFSREDAAATEDRARAQAVTEARRRAEVIAQAAGVQLGPLISLTDTSMNEGPRPLAMMARAADAEAATPVAAGELTLTAQVTGVWSLVQAGGTGDCGAPGGHHGGAHGGPGHHGMMAPQGHGAGMMPHPHGDEGMGMGGHHGMMPMQGQGAMPGHGAGMMPHPHHGEGMGDHHGMMHPHHMEDRMTPPALQGTGEPATAPRPGPEPVPSPGPGSSGPTTPPLTPAEDGAAQPAPATAEPTTGTQGTDAGAAGETGPAGSEGGSAAVSGPATDSGQAPAGVQTSPAN